MGFLVSGMKICLRMRSSGIVFWGRNEVLGENIFLAGMRDFLAGIFSLRGGLDKE